MTIQELEELLDAYAKLQSYFSELSHSLDSATAECCGVVTSLERLIKTLRDAGVTSVDAVREMKARLDLTSMN